MTVTLHNWSNLDHYGKNLDNWLITGCIQGVDQLFPDQIIKDTSQLFMTFYTTKNDTFLHLFEL